MCWLCVADPINSINGGHQALAAAIAAAEAVDTCLGELVAVATGEGYEMIIIADHGNAEKMFDEETNQPHTAHTINIVPLMIASHNLHNKNIQIPEGNLGDIAPTILQFLKIQQPTEMTGNSLLEENV